MDFELTHKQDQAYDYLMDGHTTEILFGGGAGGGKSAFGCVWLIQCCQLYPGTRWLMGRSELKILKETTLNTFFEVAGRFGFRGGGIHYNYNQQSGTIRWSNGSEILLKDLKLYPSDPNFDSLGSLEITGGFIDECNQITEKAWNIVKSRIRYKLDEFGLIPKLLGSCNPAKTFVYARFYKPHRERTLPPERAFIQALVTDNPHISKHYIANLNTLDKASKARLLDGDWEYDDDPSALIAYDAIVGLWDAGTLSTTPTHITCDVARFGSDFTVIAVWADWDIVEWHTMPKSAVTETAAKINELLQKHGLTPKRVVADEDGVGGGVVDLVRCHGFINNARPMEERVPIEGKKTLNYANLKSQCYFKLADRINRGAIRVAPGCMSVEQKERLIEELEQVKKKDIEKDGKQTVVPKEEVSAILGRSPDFSDCMMMREYFELKPARQWAVA
ncbi:hypothetical protein F5984_13280 [Rudanella paleaurantiibacter]|uniref:Phage terminase large subunit N-terminal domain-containing protein n=1 Tax=Rudanella paleaurantiibacter TaxID=2614655 RepID=A0A7J5TYC2_9BACT|nr:terminase family protein [Rudanella paleaurantiibacter]KAB7730149.1 hypothetical protein F5984_13280 [Rudanella paleaurantiibacter]